MSARSPRSAGARSARSSDPRPTGPGSPGATACDPADGCITCSDEGIPMRVIETLPADGLAICAAADGSRVEVMTDLVGAVSPGDRLLVHAGTALLALDTAPEAPEADESDGEAP